MATQSLGSFHVYGLASDAELGVIDTANEFRQRLVALYQQRHEAFVNLRNATIPDLFETLCRLETTKSRIYDTEREIKSHHSDVRDRNAVTEDQEARLVDLRQQRDSLVVESKRLLTSWYSTVIAFTVWWRTLADWKNVKTLDKRRELYAALPSPPHTVEACRELLRAEYAAKGKPLPSVLLPEMLPERLDPYATLWRHFDLLERELQQEFAPRLHSSIRGEIVEASTPKLSRTGPGMRYRYGQQPRPERWRKLTVQFGDGGLPLAGALSGSSQFSLRPLVTTHTPTHDKSVCEVSQQIGTQVSPCVATYRVKFHKGLVPDNAVFQRWSLCIDEAGNRSVSPLVSGLDFTKPTGDGTFLYSLSWTRRRAGIEVARFEGTHVREAVVIPNWLFERRLAVSESQTECDNLANAALATRDIVPAVDQRQGLCALQDYVTANPEDASLVNQCDQLEHRMLRAQRVATRALRAIEQIYHVVARRVCSRHASYVPCELDLAKLKRYDTRDLLQKDRIPLASREILFAVAPGKLKQYVEQYGLVVASVEDVPTTPVDARDTDLFTSYVASKGVKTGPKPNAPRRCSRHDTQPLVAVGNRRRAVVHPAQGVLD